MNNKNIGRHFSRKKDPIVLKKTEVSVIADYALKNINHRIIFKDTKVLAMSP